MSESAAERRIAEARRALALLRFDREHFNGDRLRSPYEAAPH